MKNEETAKRLQIALSNANMSQQELVEKSGVGKSSISHYINGSHAPSNISAGKMAKVLGVEPLWLMGFNVEMKKELSCEEGFKDVEFIKKFSLLTQRDKDIVLNLIESMISKEKSGEI